METLFKVSTHVHSGDIVTSLSSYVGVIIMESKEVVGIYNKITYSSEETK